MGAAPALPSVPMTLVGFALVGLVADAAGLRVALLGVAGAGLGIVVLGRVRLGRPIGG